MKIVVVGTGFVGLTHAAVCAELGHDVLAYDIDAARIAAYDSGERAAIERYVNEPGLAECIARHRNRGLRFTADLADLSAALGTPPALAMTSAEAVFMCLPTPPLEDGATDQTFYLAAARQVADALARRVSVGRVVVVNKSTVPIGTARMLQRILSERGARDAGAVSNPEFLPQGAALHASRNPDRIVVGADTAEDLAVMRRVYAPLLGTGRHTLIPYVETTLETAEAIKYVANSLLFTYISFWNSVGARLAECFGNISMDDLRAGVTADQRISTWGSQVGIGAGGSCFGKDIRSLIHQLESTESSTDLLRAVYQVNEHQKVYLLDRAVAEADFSFAGKTVALLGLAFKQNTNDMRDSAALRVIDALLAHGVTAIRAHDPVIDEPAARAWLDPARNPAFERISYHASVEHALQGSDALFVATDWPEYRQLGSILEQVARPPYLVLDGRRVIENAATLVTQGYSYLPVGGTLADASSQQRGAKAARSRAA